jgi:exosortase
MNEFLTRLRANATPAQLTALGAAWLVPALLFFLVPYAEGYGSHKVTLFKFWTWMSGNSEDWQHCLIVLPGALALMVYAIQRQSLPAPRPAGAAGMAVVVLSLALFWLGYRMGVQYIGWASLHLLLAGCILFLLGWRTVLFLAFPLLFIAFAWPVPFLDNYIAFPLRIMMSHAAVFVLDTIGLDVVRSGTGILSAPDPMLGIPAGQKFAVDVADPCSGIRSLFALMMVSALYAQFTLKTWWQKWALFACSAPLAILGNLARILMLTIGTIVFGAEFAIGKNALTEPSWFHMLAGYLVFIVALGGMVGIGALLTNAPKIAAATREKLNAPPAPPGPETPRGEKREDEY